MLPLKQVPIYKKPISSSRWGTIGLKGQQKKPDGSRSLAASWGDRSGHQKTGDFLLPGVSSMIKINNMYPP